MANIDFGTSWHFLFNKNKLPIDLYISEIQSLLKMQEHHCETTTNLYRKEFEQEYIGLNKEYNTAMAAAKIIYDANYNPNAVDDYDSHSLAVHEAGYNEIEHNYQIQDEHLKYRFRALADYFNKSSLVITYAMLENQLRRLCELLKEITGKRLSVQELNDRNYIQTCLIYLDKVIELEIKVLEPFETKFKDLQYLRNRIMHNGGEFPDEKNEELERIIKISDGLLELITEEEPYEEFMEDKPKDQLPKSKVLRIKKVEYLNRYFDGIKLFFEELMWIIDMKLNYEFIKNRLLFLTRFLNKDLQIKGLEVKQIPKGRQLTMALVSVDPDDSFKINLKVTLKVAAKKELVILNQANENEKLIRLINYLNDHPEIVFNDIFHGFNLTGRNQNVSLIFH